MLNSDLPGINSIGNGSSVRAAVAKLVGHAETQCSAASKTQLAHFFHTVAVRLGYVEAPAPAP